ncbi:ABC transporter ATP-binding protein [Paenibacillus rigui]|uniref:Nickel import system ATP-binding protein NikD n=1 Tax=Paenibacillus rigui TaxID=554312 RepID=A0A229UP66_9BACL|nr:ABC transporter ATP-binding protein [Paenibacillus rigui]OXM85153.1 peptide ABC transporter ATP-binding protein [Paenibacillus rigui]
MAEQYPDQCTPLLEVENLSVSFLQYAGGWGQTVLEAIQGLQLSIGAGEVVAVIGASGSGKSLLAHAIMGILPGNATMSGTIRYRGEALTERRLAALRGRELALVPQSVNYLDPLMRVGDQVRGAVPGRAAASRLRKVFERYQLAARVERLFPFQLSGGMARRVLVSTATIANPQLIIADEPTPGLHPAAVRETLGRFRELADEGCGVLLISHNIESALWIADKVAVFYAGTIVELALKNDFAADGGRLRHPYSRALWRSLPQNDFVPIPGSQPHPNDRSVGCVFAARCELASSECRSVRPDLRELREGMVRCIHAS